VSADVALRQLFQQLFGLLEVGRVKALGEPALDRRQQLTGSGALAPALPQPRLAFAALFAFDLTLRQQARREAVAPRFAPPAGPGQGKAPQNDLIFRERHDLALAGSVLCYDTVWYCPLQSFCF
jgi:hypothetical protein